MFSRIFTILGRVRGNGVLQHVARRSLNPQNLQEWPLICENPSVKRKRKKPNRFFNLASALTKVVTGLTDIERVGTR